MRNKSTFGWLDFVTGILFVALGIVLAVSPQLAVSGLVILLGIAMVFSGITDIVFYMRVRSYEGSESAPSLIGGIISVLVGALVLINPVAGTRMLNILFPLWFIVRCISRIASYGVIRRITGGVAAAVMLCLNIVGLLLGIVMIFNTALFTMSLGVLIALDLMILGASSIIEAFGEMRAT